MEVGVELSASFCLRIVLCSIVFRYLSYGYVVIEIGNGLYD